MRTHPLNSKVAMPEHLSQLRIVHYAGTLCLTDETEIYSGAIIKTPELDAIRTLFNYEAVGYEALLPGPGISERMPLADCKDHKLQSIQQGSSQGKGKVMPRTDLDDDLKIYENTWKELFLKFAWEAASVAGNDFEIRLACLQFDEEWFHFDKDVVAVLPYGGETPSTVFKGENGEIIRPDNGEMVITTPLLEHSWPVHKGQRAGLAFTVYDRQIT